MMVEILLFGSVTSTTSEVYSFARARSCAERKFVQAKTSMSLCPLDLSLLEFGTLL